MKIAGNHKLTLVLSEEFLDKIVTIKECLDLSKYKKLSVNIYVIDIYSADIFYTYSTLQILNNLVDKYLFLQLIYFHFVFSLSLLVNQDMWAGLIIFFWAL